MIRLAALVIAAEILSMGGFASFAVVLPELSEHWHLSSVAGGWICGAYYGGYVLAVPFLVGLTDRIDSRRIYGTSCLIGGIAGVGFAWYAHDPLTASLYRALAGISLAGTFMPGLRLLTERLGAGARLRVIPYYTASFGIGVSLSFFICGWLAHRYGWPAAFLTGTAGCLLAAPLVLVTTANWPPEIPEDAPTGHPLDLRPVFSNRPALAYIIAYGGHCWELFGLRAWMLALLGFSWTQTTGTPSDDTVAWWTSAIVLTGVPASILGAEAAIALGSHRLINRAAWSSVGLGLAVGVAAGWSFWLVIVLMIAYNIAIAADSGALTTGAIAHARPGQQGATMAVHSLIGFAGGTVSPMAIGVLLDLGGGMASPLAWVLAMTVTVAGSLAAALAIAHFRE